MKYLLLILTFLYFLPNTVVSQEISEIVLNISEPLNLSEDQILSVTSLMEKYRGEMDEVLAKHEDAAEPDPEKMIADIRAVRDQYRSDLSKILDKEQYGQYSLKVEQILTEMFSNLAEIRLIEMQPMFDLTDDQILQLKPVFGQSMYKMVKIIMDNAGTRLTIPKKVGLANSIKKIQKETRDGLEKTLTSEQLQAYDKWKEEQKEESE